MKNIKDELIISNYLSGKKYVFVSYASANSDTVFDEYIVPLQNKYRMNLFCDKDFKNHGTEDWSFQMKNNMHDSKLCLIFTSPEYICSYACMLEVLTAIDNNVPILNIQLESPVKSADNTELSISGTTKSAFSRLLERFKTFPEHDSRKKYYNPLLPIGDYLDKYPITRRRLSEIFIDCLANVPHTRISIKDGLETIKNSINSATGGSVFEPLDKSNVNDKKNSETDFDDSAIKSTNVLKTSSNQTTDKSTNSKNQCSATVYGESFSGTQSQVMLFIFNKITLAHTDKIDDIVDNLFNVSKTNYTLPENKIDMKSTMNAGKFFPDIGLYVGTSLSMNEKIKILSKLLAICDESADCVKSQEFVLTNVKKHNLLKSMSNSNIETDKNNVTFLLNGIRYESNQSVMLHTVMTDVIKKHSDMIDELCDNLTCITSAGSEQAKLSYFRSSKEIMVNDKPYLIGASYSFSEKLRLIKKLLKICGEPEDYFQIVS